MWVIQHSFYYCFLPFIISTINSLLRTPHHIVPEWYFLTFYAILRSIPNKLLGINVILFLFIILTFLPFIMISRRSKFLYLINILSGLFISLFILISWCGACLVQEPFISMTRYLVYPGLSLSKPLP